MTKNTAFQVGKSLKNQRHDILLSVFSDINMITFVVYFSKFGLDSPLFLFATALLPLVTIGGIHSMSLTKAQLTGSMVKGLGLPKSRSFELLKSLFEIMKTTLESEEGILISRFGKFCIKISRCVIWHNGRWDDLCALR